MKKLIIYKDEPVTNPNSKPEKKILRAINVGPSFIGIGPRGTIIRDEFKKLALILEPTMTSFTVT